MRRIQGHASDEIESLLGYSDFSSVVHRDNLVLSHSEKRSRQTWRTDAQSIMNTLGAQAQSCRQGYAHGRHQSQKRCADPGGSRDSGVKCLKFSLLMPWICGQLKKAVWMKHLKDRLLLLTGNRVDAMAEGLEQIAALPDPVGAIDHLRYRPSGIQIGHMRVPLGVIGIIYESRPNVTADAAGLCLKSGNATILRGGSEAIHSNRAIAACLRRALVDSGLSQDAMCNLSIPLIVRWLAL